MSTTANGASNFAVTERRDDVAPPPSPSAAEPGSGASAAALRDEVAALGPWFHNFHLPDGTQTAPDHFLGDFPEFKWRAIAPHIPLDLRGWRVLDIGCNAGYYSFALAQRGAEVLGIDIDPHYLSQARWACRQFHLQDRVRFRQMAVYELARLHETFDLVWFMGVFYHLRYPLLGLDLAAEKTSRMMVFQSLTMPGEHEAAVERDLAIDQRERMLEPGWPVMAFIEHRVAGDPTNWWAPNHAAVCAMLRSAGLRVVRRPAHEVYLCEPDAQARLDDRRFIRPELLAASGRSAAEG